VITSTSNPKIQQLRRLTGRRSARLDAGAFVVEGPVLVAEALAGPLEVLEVFLGEHVRAPHVGSARSEPIITPCADGVLERVLSTRTPQAMAAVVSRPDASLSAVAASRGGILVADQLADPGNAGTLIRAAEAAGFAGVVFSASSVDPFAPKVVRASAGSVLRVPVIDSTSSGRSIVESLAPRRAVGAVASGGMPHLQMSWPADVVLVIGNEAHGLGDDVIAACDVTVTIEMDGPTESLNAAMAGTLLMFDVLRSRRTGA